MHYYKCGDIIVINQCETVVTQVRKFLCKCLCIIVSSLEFKMNTCPTIKIAMFGSRSTGKTTFLTSFVGVTPEQGCSLAVSEADTQKYLRDGWQRLMMGDVIPATPMMIKEKLHFKLRYQIQGQQRDERSWNIVINDYPGKLVEWDNPSDKSSFGNAWEDENRDALSTAFKEELKKHIQKADAILFLAPIDIQTWNASDQKLYIAYINDIINTAKESREDYSRSIPFCLALMKWDMTGIKAPTAKISLDAGYVIEPQVEEYLKQNPVFQKIHSVIDNLNNDRVAVFATSAFGSHLPGDNARPDPEHLEPYNVLPILYWLCSRVEQNRLNILGREIERISALPECEEKFEQIDKAYKNILDSGLNDVEKIKELENKRKENRKAHIEYASKELVRKYDIIENDKKCRNPYSEKAVLLQQSLSKGLFKPEDERELRHQLEDLRTKARNRNIKIGVVRGAWVTLFILIAIGVLYSIDISRHVAAYANAEAILLNKKIEEISFQDYNSSKSCLDMSPCFCENYLPGVKGRRNVIEKTLNGYLNFTRQSVQDEIERIEISDSDSDNDRITKLNQKIKILAKLDPKQTPKAVIDSFKSQKENLENQLSAMNELIEYQKKVADLEKFVSTIKGLDKKVALHTIAKSPFKREDYKTSEVHLFEDIDEIRKETEKELLISFEKELHNIDVQVEEYQFSERSQIAKGKATLYETYASYYPEGDELKTSYLGKANNLLAESKELEGYKNLEQDYVSFKAPDAKERLDKAETFNNNYKRKDYPLATVVFDDVDSIIEQEKDGLFRQFTSELEENKDNELDDLETRLKNCNERDKTCTKYLNIFENDNNKRDLVIGKQNDVQNLNSKLTKWKKFEDAYNNVVRKDEDSMQSFIDLYKNDNVCKLYRKHEDYIKDIESALKDLIMKKAIARLLEQFHSFEKEYKNNKDDFSNNANKITAHINDLKKYKEKDNDIDNALETLNEMKVDNNNSWENNEYQNAVNKIQKWNNNRNQNNLTDAINSIKNDYMNGKFYRNNNKHLQELTDKLNELNEFNRNRTITISVIEYNVWGTAVNNSLTRMQLTFSFNIGNSKESFIINNAWGKNQGNLGEVEFKNKNLSNDFSMSIFNPANNGNTIFSTPINLSLLQQNKPLLGNPITKEIILKDKNGNEATVTVKISENTDN